MKQLFLLLIGLMALSASLSAQQSDTIRIADTAGIATDTLKLPVIQDTTAHPKTERPVFKLQNKFLNNQAEPVSFLVDFKNKKNADSVFYLVAGVVLLLAFFKFFYSRYFTNLFRVFFNTSLRQSQLTDQLLQAKFPSLLFNIFFIISGGIYTYFLLLYYKLMDNESMGLMMAASVLVLGIIYFIKFCTLKFTGWVTGFTEITNTYVFIIFLINKIIGIFLVPFIIIISFSENVIVKIAILISLMSIGLLLLLRFFRSYGLLQNQLKISRFHFTLYIAGIEILPLLLIYKGLMLYLSKNL